uniref:HSPB1-associated protein 1 n=1 Tax=Ceratitis capitata TaxID=7213 RepID=W8CBC2_CERCA
MAQSTTTVDTETHKLRTLILNARKPFVLRNFKMNWPCFEHTLEEWCANYDKEAHALTEFETMPCDQGNQSPHWERCRQTKQMTLTQFLEKQKSPKDDYWIGLNYKRVDSMPKSLRDGIDFSRLGFSEGSNDYSFWLCSAKTNTPCHYDSYGCNIVVQVYGRKSWLLFPPKTPLTSTRIPYEESSIYCEENLFAPNPEELQRLSKLHDSAYRCILEANDVLIVPKHWWHYVEAIDVSLSINYWIPLENDVKDQLKECLVKILIERFLHKSSDGEQKYVLNPNQLDDIQDDDEIFSILKHLYDSTNIDCPTLKSRRLNISRCPYQYIDEKTCENLIKELPADMLEYLTPMPKKDYENLINQNAKRFDALQIKVPSSTCPLSEIKKALLNSICEPTVVEHIVNEFFRRYKS